MNEALRINVDCVRVEGTGWSWDRDGEMSWSDGATWRTWQEAGYGGGKNADRGEDELCLLQCQKGAHFRD